MIGSLDILYLALLAYRIFEVIVIGTHKTDPTIDILVKS